MVLLDKVGGGGLIIFSDRYSLTIVFFPKTVFCMLFLPSSVDGLPASCLKCIILIVYN